MKTFFMRCRLPLLALLLLSVPAHSVFGQSAAKDAETLKPGDQLRIVVWRKPEMSGDFQIAGNGTITHPLYREVPVTGVPLSVVEERLRVFLAKYETNPQFVIQPLVKVVVAGEVRTPNIFSVPPETTIGQALVLAGGPTERGNLRSVRLIRDGQTITIDLTGPDAEASVLQIRSGDQLVVARRRGSALNVVAPITSSIAALAAIVSLFLR
jgi:polysaccharide export outer membrane protein